MSDVILYSKGGKYISIEDPSFRFYLNLLDLEKVRQKLYIRDDYYEYHVAVSFAGEVRSEVEKFVAHAKTQGLEVFYDFDKSPDLWGKDLGEYLADVYADQAWFMIIFISETYPQKDWTKFELAIGRRAAKKRTSEFLLPVKMDNTLMFGLDERIGYLDWRKSSPEHLVKVLLEKINRAQNDPWDETGTSSAIDLGGAN
jgi:hypothetical protein